MSETRESAEPVPCADAGCSFWGREGDWKFYAQMLHKEIKDSDVEAAVCKVVSDTTSAEEAIDNRSAACLVQNPVNGAPSDVHCA